MVRAMFSLVSIVAAKTVTLATFDGAKETTLSWQPVNDPVMGGQSKSTFTVEQPKGIFEGEVKLVPFLGAAGFCNLETTGSVSFPDVSGTDGITVNAVQTLDGGLKNFDVRFSTKQTNAAKRGAAWEAEFEVTEGQDSHFVPYSAFVCSWRGQKLSTCGNVAEQLSDVEQLVVGSGGVAGKFRLELSSLAATSKSLFAEEEDVLKLATWDGAKETTINFQKRVDPVMGGKSVASYEISPVGTALFNGSCNIVPSLAAPGFAQIVAENIPSLPDITGYDTIALKVRSSTPEYTGFRISFGAPGIPAPIIFVKQGEYKSEFNLTKTNDWQIVKVPIGYFSRDCSDFTGRCDSKDPSSTFSPGKQHYCCPASGYSPAKDEVCVEEKYLSKLNDLAVWVEGVEGVFDLEIEWIGAMKTGAAMVV